VHASDSNFELQLYPCNPRSFWGGALARGSGTSPRLRNLFLLKPPTVDGCSGGSAGIMAVTSRSS